jgi:hypothetical protein
VLGCCPFCLQCRVLDFDVVGHPRANLCFAVLMPVWTHAVQPLLSY